ncbi:MAG: acyltransferase [Agarilytica sp.]
MYKFFSLERMGSNNGSFKAEVDGLRFLAILPVLMTHAYYVFIVNVSENIFLPEFLEPYFINGGTGVHIFFVISGYVLGASFYRAAIRGQENVELKKYFLRRAIRLEPPYLISLLLFASILYLMGRYEAWELVEHFLFSALYLHNIVYGVGSTINAVAWSLEVEFQFYILAPILFYVYRSKSYSVMILLLLMAGFLLLNKFMGDSYRSLLSQGHFFSLGAVLHLTVQSTSRQLEKLHYLVVVVIFVVALNELFSLKTITPNLFSNFYKLLLLFVIFSIAFHKGLIKSLFSNRALYLVGGVCYSIYLLHYPLLSFLSRLYLGFHEFHGGSFFVFFCGAMVLVLAISFSFAVCIERPFMNFRGFQSYIASFKGKQKYDDGRPL